MRVSAAHSAARAARVIAQSTYPVMQDAVVIPSQPERLLVADGYGSSYVHRLSTTDGSFLGTSAR